MILHSKQDVATFHTALPGDWILLQPTCHKLRAIMYSESVNKVDNYGMHIRAATVLFFHSGFPATAELLYCWETACLLPE